MCQLSKAELHYLKWAVREAEGWRGTLTGNSDPQPLADFDYGIRVAKDALRKLKAAQVNQPRKERKP